MSSAPLVLIGAGSHAKVVVDIISAMHLSLDGYVDDENKPWLEEMGVQRMPEEQLQANISGAQLVMGFVGLSCAALKRRIEIMKHYEGQGAVFPTIIHPSAVISPYVRIAAGVQVLPAAIVNSHAAIEMGAVINSGAVVEHDVQVGTGVHLAPRSVALGGAKIGECAYIGSGAVVVQNIAVEAGEFVKALSVRN